MSYKQPKLPPDHELKTMSFSDLFYLILDIEQAQTINERIYQDKQAKFADAVALLKDVFGNTNACIDELVRLEHSIPQPPHLANMYALLKHIRSVRQPDMPSERDKLLEEMTQLGLSINTHKSTKELKRIVERHYIRKLRTVIMDGGPLYQNYDHTACHPSCAGWDGVSSTCSCGRSVLRWMLGPSHTPATPQLIAGRIAIRN